MISRRILIAAALSVLPAGAARAQKAPEVGYAWPPGARAGTTVTVRLCGYDWTPDVRLFAHDPRVRLEPAGPISQIHVPPPPYWFGTKAYAGALPLARELPVRITLPADLPSGPVRWRVANASGGSGAAVFWVSRDTEVVEDEPRSGAQPLPELPLTVSGRLFRIAEVDRYSFVAPRTGPVTAALFARRLGSDINGVLEVRELGCPLGVRLVADVVDTEGRDTALTFAARGGVRYEVSVHDLDFRGDRAFVYRLALSVGHRIVAAVPAAVRRGRTQEVELLGYGVSTGAARLERVRRQVAAPAEAGERIDYRLETPWGTSPAFSLPVSDIPEHAAPAAGEPILLPLPGAVSGILGRQGEVRRFLLEGKKGDAWTLTADARRLGSPLDVAVALIGPDGKDVARGDDLPGTTDAALAATLPADGRYQVVVSGLSGHGPASVFRLEAARVEPGFALRVEQATVSVPVDGDGLAKGAEITVTAERRGGFAGVIALDVEGLPAGMSVVGKPEIAAGVRQVKLTLRAAPGTAAEAALVRITGRAEIAGQAVTARTLAAAAGNLAPLEQETVDGVLVAGVLSPRWKAVVVDDDGGHRIPRGSTYPAEIRLERLDGFAEDIVLQMAARQDRHRQGISGPELVVPVGESLPKYPVFMPEWLETTRTSRMIVVSVARVLDPTGAPRWLLVPVQGRITMWMEGALLKLSHEADELSARPGDVISVPVRLLRSATLPLPVRLELVPPETGEPAVALEPVTVPPGQDAALVRARVLPGPSGLRRFTLRATALQDGRYPVVSETEVELMVPAAPQTPARRARR